MNTYDEFDEGVIKKKNLCFVFIHMHVLKIGFLHLLDWSSCIIELNIYAATSALYIMYLHTAV